MDWIDTAAHVAARRFAKMPFVTASVDEIVFRYYLYDVVLVCLYMLVCCMCMCVIMCIYVRVCSCVSDTSVYRIVLPSYIITYVDEYLKYTYTIYTDTLSSLVRWCY